MLQRVEYAVKGIPNGEDEASGKLTQVGARVHQCRGIGHEFELRHHIVKLVFPCLYLVPFVLQHLEHLIERDFHLFPEVEPLIRFVEHPDVVYVQHHVLRFFRKAFEFRELLNRLILVLVENLFMIKEVNEGEMAGNPPEKLARGFRHIPLLILKQIPRFQNLYRVNGELEFVPHAEYFLRLPDPFPFLPVEDIRLRCLRMPILY